MPLRFFYWAMALVRVAQTCSVRVAQTCSVRDAVSHESQRRNHGYTFVISALVVLTRFFAPYAGKFRQAAEGQVYPQGRRLLPKCLDVFGKKER